MKKLLKYLKSYLKETILGPLFKLLEATLELLVPIVVKIIIDNGVNANDQKIIIKYSIILIIMAFVGLIFSVIAQYFAAKAAVGFVSKIRYGLFKHIEELSYLEIDKIGSSSLITNMTSDMNQVQNGVNLTLRLLLRSPFVVIGSMIMAFTIDTKLALIFLITIPVLFIVVIIIMKITSPLYKNVQQKLDDVLKSTRENLTGARVIRAFAKEEKESINYNKKNVALTEVSKKVGKISSLLNPITYVIVNFAIIILLHFGAIKVNSGSLTQGDVIALYNYMSQILVELIKFANLVITISKAIACGNRIQNVFEIKSSIKNGEIKENSPENDNIIEFKNVSLSYHKSGDNSLDNLSFSIKKGEIVGIIGGTGSGKTSLINLIPRFYDATQGDVFYNGKNVKEYDTVFLRDEIGIVSQKAVLFKGTIKDNLKWGNKDASDEELYKALEISQAIEIVKQKENNLLFEIKQNGSNLSGGQKQRLCIARAIVKKPQVLILDDSASALDYQTEAALRNAIKNHIMATTIIVSQRTSSIMHANKIICLDDGKIVGIGTHEELLQNCAVYQEIYNSQYAN